MQQNGNSRPPNTLKPNRMKQAELIKEPCMSPLQNFLFYFPGIGFFCITIMSCGSCVVIMHGIIEIFSV